jgi:Sec-independent protein translocase protein TatA
MQDLLLILVVVLILVLVWRGPKTLPKLGEALGRGVKEARKEAADIREDIQGRVGDDGQTLDEPPAAPAPQPPAPTVPPEDGRPAGS